MHIQKRELLQILVLRYLLTLSRYLLEQVANIDLTGKEAGRIGLVLRSMLAFPALLTCACDRTSGLLAIRL